MTLRNLGAERGLITGLVNNPDMFFEVDAVLNSRDFDDSCNAQTYELLKHIIVNKGAKVIDKMLLITEAKELNLTNYFQNTNNYDRLDPFFIDVVDKTNLMEFAVCIKEYSLKRGLLKSLSDSANFVENSRTIPIGEVISKAESTVFDYVKDITKTDDLKSLTDGFLDWVNDVADNPRENVGVTTGFDEYDKLIGGGCRKKSVNVIVARAKNGKSTFGLNAAKYNAIDKKIPTLYLDTELAFEEQRFRMGGCISGVPYSELETGFWRASEDKIRKVSDAWKKMKDAPDFYHINVAGMDIDSIISIIRKFVAKHVGYNPDGTTKDCFVVFDYLKMMDYSGMSKNMSEYQLLGIQLTKLHDTAIRYDIPILTMVQSNRDGLNREDEGIVAGSDRISWFCSSLTLLKRKTPEEINEDGGPENGNCKLKVLLARFGPGHFGDEYISLQTDYTLPAMKEVKGRNTIIQELARNSQVIVAEKDKNKKLKEASIRRIDEKD